MLEDVEVCKIVVLLQQSFAATHPRLVFEFRVGTIGRIDVVLRENDDGGAFRGQIEQTIDLVDALGHASAERTTIFIEGCALAARAKAAAQATGSLINWLSPEDLFPTVLISEEALTSAGVFALAINEPWGPRARLETRGLCEALSAEFPEAMAAIRTDADLVLVDALFALWSDRYDNERSLELLANVSGESGEGRRHLAPLLVAFLDKTASDIDFLSNAYLLRGQRTPHPLCQDMAYRILASWGIEVASRVDGWLATGAISRDIVGG